VQGEVALPVTAGGDEPFWFGRDGRAAFGWYHAPRSTPRGIGVALCPSLGHEMLCTHRAYRHLAERLAARGFAVLRFDYHGTGDSADGAAAGVEAWLDTIDDAVCVLRDEGCGRVALFGWRGGATLAAAAAARRGDVDAVALVAPLATGSAFLRELRAMQSARGSASDAKDGDEEAIGFVFARETVADLGRIDLRALRAPPARRTLLVPRDDIAGAEARIAERWRALGGGVDVVRASGYALLAADDPYVAEVPDAMWSAVTTWLEGLPARPAEARGRRISRAPTTELDDLAESTLRYGPADRLFGILTEPRGRRDDVGVVVSNTGANSRVGPGRLGVALARRIARAGHGVLRADLAGIGDSPPHDGAGENELYADHSVDDVRAAIDALVARGYRRIVAVGLCSGAYLSFKTALADERVAAAVLMNPPVFEWTPGRKVERIPNRRPDSFRSMRYYRRRAFELDTWRRALRGDVQARAIARVIASRLALRGRGLAQRAAARVGRGEWLMSDLARKFAGLARRDARVLLLFHDEEPMLDEIESRLGGAMGWLASRGLELVVVERGDHVFSPVAARREAIERVAGFVERFARERR